MRDRRWEVLADEIFGPQRRVPIAPLTRKPKPPLAQRLERYGNVRYWGWLKNRRGQKVRFCWTTQRNPVGYFVGWREIHMKNGRVKRDQWAARRSRKALKALALRRHKKLQQAPVAAQ